MHKSFFNFSPLLLTCVRVVRTLQGGKLTFTAYGPCMPSFEVEEIKEPRKIESKQSYKLTRRPTAVSKSPPPSSSHGPPEQAAATPFE